MPVTRLVPPQEWPSLGWGVIEWIEDHLCHGPGDIEGEPIELDDELAQFIVDCYRLYPQDHAQAGQRVVTYAELSRAKGRAKSELAGMIVCAEFLGPVRFDYWGADGEPVGKAVTSPFIRCLATEETQTGNTYDNVYVMLAHAAERFPDDFGHLEVGLTRIAMKGRRGVEIRPCSAASASKDGGKETFAVADETHLYDSPELRRMHRTVKRNCRKRKAAQPWMLATTTQFEPGKGSTAEVNRDDAEAQLAGRRRRRLGFCWDHREGHAVEDWDDDKELAAALAEAYGSFAEHMDLLTLLNEEIRSADVTREDAERFWLNRRVQGAGKAINPNEWDALADSTRPPPPDGAEVVLCFDGSKTQDCTALLGWALPTEPGERPHLFCVEIWERPDGATATWKVPRDQVDGEVHSAFARWKVRRLVADPAYWREYLDRWAEEFGDDIVIEFRTNSGAAMGPAVSRFLDEAIPDGTFTHDGDLVVRRHHLNAIRGRTRGGYPAVFKEKESLKIDALAASIIGYAELVHIEDEAPAKQGFVMVIGGSTP